MRRSAWIEDAEHFHRVLLGASTFFEKAHQDFLDDVGLTPSQFYLLRTIGASPNRALSPKELQRSFVRRRNLTETVDRVIRDGLATREPNPEDGRSVLIVLTAHGDDVLLRAVEVYRAGLRRLLSPGEDRSRATAVEFLESFIEHVCAVIGVEHEPAGELCRDSNVHVSRPRQPARSAGRRR